MIPAVHVLFLRYTGEHHDSALRALRDKVLAPCFPGLDPYVLVVDNAVAPEHSGRTPEGWPLIGGDNALKEFSGWTRALDLPAPRERWSADDAVILCNDTFHRNYDVSYLERFDREPVRDWVEQGALVGHVDLYPREIELFGLPMRHWVRSSFVLCRWGSLARLLPLTTPGGPEALFAADPGEFFRPDCPLSALYQSYLESFLLGREGEYRCRWHTRIREDSEGLARLKVKAHTIVCEHWLSARARRLALPLRDVSGNLARREADMTAMAAAEKASPTGVRP